MKNKSYLFLFALLCADNAQSHSFTPPDYSGPVAHAEKPAPLSFIENKGQLHDQYGKPGNDIQFMVPAAHGLSIFIGSGAIHYQFSTKSAAGKSVSQRTSHDADFLLPSSAEHDRYTTSRIDAELVGANKNAKIVTAQSGDYYERYFTSAMPSKGATAHSYGRITCKDIYPHIDWVMYINGAHVEQEFVINKGGKVGDIKIRYSGCSGFKLDKTGALLSSCPQGTITENAPHAYQADGKEITSRFKLDGNILSYETGKYSGTLVIDPEFAWATYYGGSGDEQGSAVATDTAGNVYMASSTSSASGIVTTGAYQDTFAGGSYDGFIVKFNSVGTRLWATYFGGSGADGMTSVAVDAAGNAYVTGFTNSTSGIATAAGFQNSFGGGSYDAFLAKFNTSGTLKWGTYLGGNDADFAWSVATDHAGNVFVGGQTRSTSGIATPTAWQPTIGDGIGATEDAFLAKYDSMGDLEWATYYGGNDKDFGNGIATDISGNVYITGITLSDTGLASSGVFQTVNNAGGYDAFLAKFNTSGTRLWGTFYGGTQDDQATAVAADTLGNVYITGYTKSTTNMATPGCYQGILGGGYDCFLAKFNNAGGRTWGTYYGGGTDDNAFALAADDSGNVCITGWTTSSSGIATSGAYGGGSYDAFIAKLDSSGARQWATYFGGSDVDQAYGIAIDAARNIYITGNTLSTSGIASTGALQGAFGGGTSLGDAFLARFSRDPYLGVKGIEKALTNSISIYPNPASDNFTINAATDGQLTIYTIDGREAGSYKLIKGATNISLPPACTTGTYLCTCIGNDGSSASVKLVLER